MTLPRSRLHDDLTTVLRAAIEGVDAGRLVERALQHAQTLGLIQRASALDVIAAGKAAAAMLNAFVAASRVRPRVLLAVGPQQPLTLPEGTEWWTGGHPLPNAESVTAARRALEIARGARRDDLLVVLLSGGGSALMTLPAVDVSLTEKQNTARLLMEHGADIYELNTVRKHLSAIKGGQLAAASSGSVLTLAISDVVGDDLSVIASGPTSADDSTFAQALNVLGRRGGAELYPDAVVRHLRCGAAGEMSETPKTGDPRLERSTARVIGPQRGAIEGAARAAERLGYHVHVVREPVTGEARIAAGAHVQRVAAAVASLPRPVCVISSGETTVTVVGKGKGGRNQEFAFALARTLELVGPRVIAASIGTDGIDGPTDAAGAIVDPSTFTRAHAAGISAPDGYLDDNNTYAFFDRLGDLIRTGPTSTNVGDLQVILVDA